MQTYTKQYFDPTEKDMKLNRFIPLHKFATPIFDFKENEVLVVEITELKKHCDIVGAFFRWEKYGTIYYHIVSDNYIDDHPKVKEVHRKSLIYNEFLHFLDYYIDNVLESKDENNLGFYMSQQYVIDKYKKNIRNIVSNMTFEKIYKLEPFSEAKLRLLLLTVYSKVLV
jgi:hypothetical protein